MDTELVVESSRCLEFFQAFDPEINQDNLISIAAKAETQGGSSLQQHLSKILRDHQRTKVVSQFQDPRDVAWLESLRDPHAGLWLDFAPKTAMHHIANDEFRVALTLRLRLPQKCILPGTMCDCRKGKSASGSLRNSSHHGLYLGRQLHPQPRSHEGADGQDPVLLWTQYQGRGEERV